MIYVVAGGEPSEADSEWILVRPVLALQSILVDEYVIEDQGGICVLPFNHEDALDQGWTYGGREQRCGALVYDDDYGIISTVDTLMVLSYHEVSDFVFLPWPYDEAKDKAAVETCTQKLREAWASKVKDCKCALCKRKE